MKGIIMTEQTQTPTEDAPENVVDVKVPFYKNRRIVKIAAISTAAVVAVTVVASRLKKNETETETTYDQDVTVESDSSLT